MYYSAYSYGYSSCQLNDNRWIRRKSKSNNISGDSIPYIILYLLSRKQVKLLIQAFKQNGIKEINKIIYSI